MGAARTITAVSIGLGISLYDALSFLGLDSAWLNTVLPNIPNLRVYILLGVPILVGLASYSSSESSYSS